MPKPLVNEWLDFILEQSLHAISDLIVSAKNHNTAQLLSPYNKQVGRVDVKFFGLDTAEQGCLATSINPLYRPSAIKLLSALLPNMIVSPNPLDSPLMPVARRLIGALDLFNNGYYNEAFIIASPFWMILCSGSVQPECNNKAWTIISKQNLRGIKEQRLEHFTCNLMPLCGWKSLKKEMAELHNRLLGKSGTNAIRNRVVHGDLQLTRDHARLHIQTITDVIGWLSHKSVWVYYREPPAIEHGRIGICHS